MTIKSQNLKKNLKKQSIKEKSKSDIDNVDDVDDVDDDTTTSLVKIVKKSELDYDTNLSNEEFGGRKGPEPTRYGDWEKNGRCIDF